MTETKKKTAVTKTPRAKKAKAETTEAIPLVPAEQHVSEEAVVAERLKEGSFIFALGRRKTAIARVRLIRNGKGMISVNGKTVESYFGTEELRNILKGPLGLVGQETAVDVSASVEGGGVHSQAEAIRLGICRALVVLNPTYRKTLKKLGYLTRDPRAKERKKPGLKRARRAPQWSKR
jgi:small subunit ribosomal protein S9